MELNTIFNEDCFETIKRMGSKSVNLVLTSPPYNMTNRKGGLTDSGRYDVYKDWMNEDEYLEFTKDLFNALDRVIVDNGVILYNFNYSIENPSLPYKVVTSIVENTNWKLMDTICWKKNSGLPFPANKTRLSRNWEFVFVFAKNNNFFVDKKVSKIAENGQVYYNTYYNFIEAKNNDGSTKKLNQATFSSELVTKLLNLYCGNDFVVYDPFMGTGTTAVGCVISEKKPSFLGSEISPNQVEYALKRINDIQRKS